MSNFTKFVIALVVIIVASFSYVIIKDNNTIEGTKVNQEDVVKQQQEVADQAKESVKGTKKADLTAEEGDTVIIDYVGISNGVEFSGGTATDASLVLGSDTYIPGFEDQLIGHKIGDLVEVKVTFPEDYSQESLAGNEATFVTVIKDIEKQ